MAEQVTRVVTLLCMDQPGPADAEAAFFQTISGAYGAAFSTPRAALAVARAIQQAYRPPPGDDESQPPRIGVHTGAATERAGTWGGPALGRARCLMDAGHPGQILVSRTTAEIARGALPRDSILQDLGERRLRDLLPRERVFGLVSATHPSVFPPLRTLDLLPNNLSPQLYPLVGREMEVAVIERLLSQPSVRVVTLTGVPGTGKTRLALQVAADLLPNIAGGAWFVALAPIQDPARVPSAIAQVLGVKESPGAPLADTLKTHLLRARQVLLVLDNFEHVQAAVPALADLLAAAPGLRVLATSREALHVTSEVTFAVPPLGVPDLGRLPPLATLARTESVALFTARAQESQPSFQLTEENAPAVAAICARLDGLPLAIELAAARSRELPPTALLARLDRSTGQESLRVLTTGASYLPARQQTLRGAIGWSYQLLAPVEQQLFARLAVFLTGCTLEAAEAVLGEGSEITEEMLGASLHLLTDKSLLRRETGPDGAPRWRMLETIRAYALERLEESGEVAILRGRHAAYYLALAEAAATTWGGPREGPWLALIDQDHDNLRAALAWSRKEGTGRDLGLRLATALAPFWEARGFLSEGRQWLESVLAAAPQTAVQQRAQALLALGRLLLAQADYAQATAIYDEVTTLARSLADLGVLALVLNQSGNMAFWRGDYARARDLYQESMALRRTLGQPRDIAASLNNLAITFSIQGDYPQASSLLREALAIRREIGDLRASTIVLSNLAEIALHQGQPEEARRLYDESLALRRELGDKPGMASSMADLGGVDQAQGRLAEAEAHFAESLALNREIGNQLGIARALYLLGSVATRRGDPTRATRLLKESLSLCRDLGIKPDIAEALAGLSTAAGARGDAERAARLQGAMRTLYATLGTPRQEALQTPDDAALAPARIALGAAAWAAAEAAGAALPLDAAITYALEEAPAPGA